MITLNIDFECIVCNQKKEWYIMPFEEKTSTGDRVRSMNKYRLQCKKCGENYIFTFNINKK